MEGLEPCRNDPVRQGSFAESAGRDATRATVQMLAPGVVITQAFRVVASRQNAGCQSAR
jgi:hypothetical protein